MVETSQYDARRQSARVLLRVPVEVHGTAGDGTSLREDAHTGVVGAHGAMVRMSSTLQMGSAVEVTNRFSQQTAEFRVVWVKGPQNGDLCEVGIESLKPLDDFWGVRFPRKP